MPRKSKQLENPYKGDLNRPIKLDRLPMGAGISTILFPKDENQIEQEKKECSEIETEFSRYIISEICRKMELLLDHYNISEDDPQKWFMLSLYLAKDRVPGFCIEEGGQEGRPLDWNFFEDKLLLLQVADLIHSDKPGKGKTVGWACRILVKESPWKDKKGKGGQTITAKTLENRHARVGWQEMPEDPKLRKIMVERFYELLSDPAVKDALRKKKVSQ